MRHSADTHRLDCAVDVTMSFIEGRWKPTILCKLGIKGDMRFSDLRNDTAGLSSKVLANQLKEMESDGLIRKAPASDGSKATVYSITPFGMSLMPVLKSMADWALANGRMNMVTFDGIDTQ